MINKGQKKRVLSESDLIGKSQDSNKNVQPLKKIKNIKQEVGVGAEVQKNDVKKVVKSKTEGAVQNQSSPLSQQTAKKEKELKGKKMVLVNSKKVNLKYKLIKKEEKEDNSVEKQTKKSIRQKLKKGQKEEGEQKVANGKLSLEEKIAEIESRKELTKTSKRKLRILRKKLSIEKGTLMPQHEVVPKKTSDITKSQARKLRRKQSAERRSQNDTESDTTTKSKNVVKPVNVQKSTKKAPEPNDKSAVKGTKHQNVKILGPVKSEKIQKQLGKGATKAVQENKLNGKNKVQIMKQSKGGNKNQLIKKGALPLIKIKKQIKEEKDDPEDEDEDETEDEDEDEDEDETEDEDEVENEDTDNTLNSSLNASADEDDEDEDEDGDEEEEEDDDEDDEEVQLKEPQAKKPRQEQSIKKAANPKNLDSPEKKKRYVLFVGNLPYDATTEDVKKHFLTKVSKVVSVRIPTKPGSNTPRGIGYVEVTNDKDYEKALSFHNTVLNGRRLNVEYTKTGSKNVRNNSDVVAKNKKLHALRKAGVLAGSQKHDQKRSVRRAKHIKAN